MFSAKKLADFGYKTFSCSMMLLTATIASMFTYRSYQIFVEASEPNKQQEAPQQDQPASP